MEMDNSPFCIARVGEPADSPDGHEVEFVFTELADTNAVITFLQTTHDRFATRIADENAERTDTERIDTGSIGGFGVQLTNRCGGVIEIGLGRQFCLLMRLKPEPFRIYGNPNQLDGMLVFYIDGWHHTEMENSDLLARDECLACLRIWLESNELPNSA